MTTNNNIIIIIINININNIIHIIHILSNNKRFLVIIIFLSLRSDLEMTLPAVRPVPRSVEITLGRRKPSETPALGWTAAPSQIPAATSPVPRSAGRRQTGQRPGNTRASDHIQLSVKYKSIK